MSLCNFVGTKLFITGNVFLGNFVGTKLFITGV